MSTRPYLLVSNDDGINSFFLRALVHSLHDSGYELCVVAPAEEQSWVGRAMTRSGKLTAIPHDDWPCPTWSLSGRPADCVNVGLAHLVTRRPDAVISGMNLGFNMSLPLTLSSGTVAAATEGALAGLKAIAFSLSIPHDDFLSVSQQRGRRDAAGNQITETAAQIAARLVDGLIQTPTQPYEVHNINFPSNVTLQSPIKQTSLALGQMAPLFEEEKNHDHRQRERHFSFKFPRNWTYTDNPETSDLQTLQRGEISHCILRWDQLSYNMM